MPVANDAERDAAARSVARTAEAAWNVATGPSAGGFMNLGAAGPTGAAAPDADEHVSLSAARSAHDAAPLGEANLPSDYKVHLSQAARRGDQILWGDQEHPKHQKCLTFLNV